MEDVNILTLVESSLDRLLTSYHAPVSVKRRPRTAGLTLQTGCKMHAAEFSINVMIPISACHKQTGLGVIQALRSENLYSGQPEQRYYQYSCYEFYD